MSSSEEKKFVLETRTVLQSGEIGRIRAKIHDLKTSGRAAILPLVLDLLTRPNEEEEIIQDVIQLLCDLKEQSCAPVIIDYIRTRNMGDHLAGVLSACWQSRLDFSDYLPVFVDCFIKGNYRESLEAFTVIEEMLWKTKPEIAIESILELEKNQKQIDKEKMPLYRELIKVLNDGESYNRKDYPDIYDR